MTRRHIIHQDLLNRNILVQGAEITAVIDWGNSLYGDYLYDAAWLMFWWPWFPAWQAIDISTELHPALGRGLAAFRRCGSLPKPGFITPAAGRAAGSGTMRAWITMPRPSQRL